MRRDGGNQHEKLGVKRMSCAAQLTIPHKVDTTPDLAGKITNTTSSNPNHGSHTRDF